MAFYFLRPLSNSERERLGTRYLQQAKRVQRFLVVGSNSSTRLCYFQVLARGKPMISVWVKHRSVGCEPRSVPKADSTLAPILERRNEAS